MLGTHDKDDMSRTLLAMSSSQDSCIAMRQSGTVIKFEHNVYFFSLPDLKRWGVHGRVVRVVDLELLTPHDSGFESHQGL